MTTNLCAGHGKRITLTMKNLNLLKELRKIQEFSRKEKTTLDNTEVIYLQIKKFIKIQQIKSIIRENNAFKIKRNLQFKTILDQIKCLFDI
jgi:hypothetical protein